MSGTYSILYDGWKPGDDIYSQYAIDWDWRIPGQWARSDRGGPGTAWYITEGLDDKAYRALLEHFGLENYADEFPPIRVITMSPAKLAAARRKKERLYGLKRKEMVSNTLGDHRPAEEYK